jgi:hypothetical protein
VPFAVASTCRVVVAGAEVAALTVPAISRAATQVPMARFRSKGWIVMADPVRRVGWAREGPAKPATIRM